MHINVRCVLSYHADKDYRDSLLSSLPKGVRADAFTFEVYGFVEVEATQEQARDIQRLPLVGSVSHSIDRGIRLGGDGNAY